MGAPTSDLIAEFFLQNLESIHLAHLAEKHKIAGYFGYVDDILLTYDCDHTNIQDIANDFNSLHPNLKFTTEIETNNKLNYLDITIHRTPHRLENLNIQETHLQSLKSSRTPPTILLNTNTPQ